MKYRNLITLLVVAVILVGGAIVANRRNRPSAPVVTGRPVLTAFDVNAVRKVVVTDGIRTVTAHRPGEVWVVADHFDYPADIAKIRELVIKLADLKIGQVARLSAEQKARLKLLAPAPDTEKEGEPTNAGTRVTLHDAQGGVLATLLVGAEYMRQPAAGDGAGMGGYPEGRYVSPDNGETVYIVADTLREVSTEPLFLVDASILAVPAHEVESVTVQAPGEGPLRFEEEGGALVLRGLAEDEETDSSKAQNIRSALSWLRFQGIADPALTDEQTGMADAVRFVAVNAKGQIFAVSVGGPAVDGDGHYARFSVSLKPEPDPEPEGEEDEEAAKRRAEAAEQRRTQRAELETETDELRRKLERWTYTIPSHTADSLRVERAAVVKKTVAAETPPVETDPLGENP